MPLPDYWIVRVSMFIGLGAALNRVCLDFTASVFCNHLGDWQRMIEGFASTFRQVCLDQIALISDDGPFCKILD